LDYWWTYAKRGIPLLYNHFPNSVYKMFSASNVSKYSDQSHFKVYYDFGADKLGMKKKREEKRTKNKPNRKNKIDNIILCNHFPY
jgi:hypothetical protein